MKLPLQVTVFMEGGVCQDVAVTAADGSPVEFNYNIEDADEAGEPGESICPLCHEPITTDDKTEFGEYGLCHKNCPDFGVES